MKNIPLIRYIYVLLPFMIFIPLVSFANNLNDIAKDHPEIVERLQKLAEPTRKELGDTLRQIKGTENRPLGLAP